MFNFYFELLTSKHQVVGLCWMGFQMFFPQEDHQQESGAGARSCRSTPHPYFSWRSYQPLGRAGKSSPPSPLAGHWHHQPSDSQPGLSHDLDGCVFIQSITASVQLICCFWQWVHGIDYILFVKNFFISAAVMIQPSPASRRRAIRDLMTNKWTCVLSPRQPPICYLVPSNCES